jgi:nucleotide-binding universal stress UspA family protein
MVASSMNTHSEINRAEASGTHRAPQEGRGIRRILVCLDRSPLSEACLPYATFMSRTFGSSITLLHVMQPWRERSGAHATDAFEWEIARQQAGAYLERFEREAADASGQPVDTRLEQGHPAERIRAVARDIGADLVVLGTYGEGGMTAWNLGSTVQQLLAFVEESVMIARPGAALHGAFSPQQILVPLDGSLRTESILPVALRIAKSHDAELLLAHVVPELIPSGVLRVAHEEEVEMARELGRRLESRATAYLGQLQNNLAPEVRSVRTTVIRGADPCQSLLELSDREHVDLVVLSAHGSTCNRERSFGAVATHLLAHSVAPVLVLQDLLELDAHRANEDPARRAPLRSGFAKDRH